MKFCIAIPVCGQDDFLPSALESIRVQARDVNLAVMDATPDNSVQNVLENYRGLLAYHRHGPDAGQSAAIREGWDNTDGEILAWLCADDYYFPDALDAVKKVFISHPDVDVVYGDAIHINRDGFFLSYFPPIQEFNARDLTHTCFICQPACFIRRRAYEKAGGIDPSLHFTMDWDLWCRLAVSGAKFFYLRHVLAAVRYYPGTKTLSGRKQRYLEIWHMERKYGQRFLPLSWPGFYLYDLSFEEKKTIRDNIAFGFLQFLRITKKSLVWMIKNGTKKEPVNYGFHRWKTKVAGRGTINLPWYDKRRLDKINLQVKPENCNFRITVNDDEPQIFTANETSLSFDLPQLPGAVIKITIECLDQYYWKLLDFDGKLNS